MNDENRKPLTDDFILDDQFAFNKFLVTPDSQDRLGFAHINKDLELSLLDKEEISYLNSLFRFVGVLSFFFKSDDKDSEDAITSRNAKGWLWQEIYQYLSLNKSLGGFGRKLLVSKTIKQQHEISEKKEKGLKEAFKFT